MNLIIGQGIAGTTLALTLLEMGEEVKLIDSGYQQSSSMVAAGLWNPIVFRRINLSWQAHRFIDRIFEFYPRMETILGEKFFYPLSVCRVHSSVLERQLWEEKQADDLFSRFLGDSISIQGLTLRCDAAPHGMSLVKESGFLDVPAYLQSARRYFFSKGMIEETSFTADVDAEQMDFLSGKFLRIIDCRGHQSAASPWFKWLPFGLTKGEVLTLKCSDLDLQYIFNAGFFLAPIGDGNYRLGATFNWEDKTTEPTPQASEELITKLMAKVGLKHEVVGHKAGIRPTVQDRRPIVGRHPEHKNLYIFNGLGTKGVLIAPWLAQHFSNHLITGQDLQPDVNIERFAHLVGQNNPLINYPIG